MAAQENDPDSVLNYYRRLVALRKSAAYKEVFTYGEFIPAYENLDGIMAFYRKDDSAHILVAANFGKKLVDIELEYMLKKVLLANRSHEEIGGTIGTIRLDSCDAVVLELM